jgi:hypothetical protein
LSHGREQHQSLVLFICGFFNETTLSAAQTTQRRMAGRLMNYELVWMFKKGIRTISRYCLVARLEEVGKIKKIFNQGSLCPGRDSNQVP